MRRSRKPVWAFSVHRGFESLPLRSSRSREMASVGQPQALPVPARRASLAPVLEHVRRGLGLLSLGGLVYCGYVIASGAANRPTLLVPARTGGFPLWLRGPLTDLGFFLRYHDFAIYVVVMLGCFL